MKLLTIPEVSDQTGIPVQTLYGLAREGVIPTVRFGRLIRVSPEALDEFIKNGGKSFNGGWKKNQA